VAWRGDIPFWIKYPRLFSLSIQKEAKLVTYVLMVFWRECSFSWRRPFFVWETLIFGELMEDLVGFRRTETCDEWRGKLEENDILLVKSLYKKLEVMVLGEGSLTDVQLRVFTQIWKSPTPAKAVPFSWKLILDRILT
jgi:hypothetical protein